MQDRLTEIVFSLLQSERMTARSLSERFGVSIRTIYRDIDRLSAAGVPVYTDRGNGGGVSLYENYRLTNAYLTSAEQCELVALLKAFNAAGGGRSALCNKLSGLFKTDADYIEVDLSDWHNDGSVMERFDTLKRCIVFRKVARAAYRNGSGGTTMRELEPLKLIFKSRAWYLYAYCRLRGENRMFKLARFTAIEETDEIFNRLCTETHIARNLEWKRDTLVVKLKVAEDARGRLYDEAAADKIETLPDGDAVAQFTFPMGDWVIGYLLSFGDRATVLEPTWLGERVRAIHRAAAERE